MKNVDGITVFGDADERTMEQAKNCLNTGNVAGVVLCADNHLGYSQPIGGVVAYRGQVSPSGVGYDIACGNKAVQTNLDVTNIKKDLPAIMDAIQSTISFGVGRVNESPVDHPVFYSESWDVYKDIGAKTYNALLSLARSQLGTVGSGNHYVDLFAGPENKLWIGVHFGSRGLGFKTASGFLNLANGRQWSDKAPGEKMDQAPTLIDVHAPLGESYLRAMELAGQYAYAGRNLVVEQVLKILGAKSLFEVHNHHNFAWLEEHNGEKVYVVRKGATPSAPGQLGFIGGSMCDIAVIVEGLDTQENKEGLYSTVHGAGRIMSRTQAAGKMNYKTRRRMGGQITPEQMKKAVEHYGVELRGAGTDESPFVYRKLLDVLKAHARTIRMKAILKPIGVCMAGENEFDPYKD